MRCTTPPPLSDDDLSAILDGFTDDQIQKHLEACPACAAKLHEMRKLEVTLQQQLRRFECPSPLKLGDYHLKMLTGDDHQRINNHLKICPLCQNELNLLVQFLNNSSADADETKPAQIVRPSESLWHAEPIIVSGNLAIRSLRGSDESRSHDVKVNSANIYIETRANGQGFLLTGQVIDDDVNWVGAITEIWQGDLPQQIYILDEMCEFKAELTNPNPVTLHITSTNEIMIMIKNIRLEN